MIVFLLSLLPVYTYVGLRIASHWSHWVILFIGFGLILSFPFRKRFRYQLHLSYAAMAILTYITVFSVLRDLVYVYSDDLYPSSYVLILAFMSCVVGFINAVSGPKIKKVTVPIAAHAPTLHGLKIVQISDLHIGATIKQKYVSKVVKKINKLEADLVVLTGDIGDGKVSTLEKDILPLAKLQAKYGIFFTPGNHEYYWNVDEWLKAMSKAGIINLVNDHRIILHREKSVLIAGIPDPVSRVLPDFNSFRNASADYRILLSHRPGIALEASENAIDLTLSGHTHAGQFFPWTIVVKFVHKISKGLHQVGRMWIYVNPGTGSWGPLIRLGTSPEITLLTLTQSNNDEKI